MYVRFVATWLVIITIASIDSYLTVKHSPVMDDVEINPVGMMVLKSSGGVPLLIAMKTGGVACALLFCLSLWQKEWLRPKILISSYSVACLALGMMGFMAVDVIGIRTWGIAEGLGLRPVAKWSRPDAPRPIPWNPPSIEKNSPSAKLTHPVIQSGFDSTEVLSATPVAIVEREEPQMVATVEKNEPQHARTDSPAGSPSTESISL
jgi:hypothetical protein